MIDKSTFSVSLNIPDVYHMTARENNIPRIIAGMMNKKAYVTTRKIRPVFGTPNILKIANSNFF